MCLANVRFVGWLIAGLLLVLTSSVGCEPASTPHPPQSDLAPQTPVPLRSEEKEEGLTVTIVFDNYQYDPNLRTAWGFSCLVEGLGKTILFDSGGDGNLLLANMNKLQIDPQQVDIVVLSHIHADHTGGLAAFLNENSQVTVFVPQSFPANFSREVTEAGAEYVEVGESTQICEHAFSTGELGTAIKEQALAIETSQGLVVITGCAHPGVANMVRRAKEVLDKEVYLVIGGFHMSGFSDRQVNQVIRDFQQLGVQKAAPSHCSGDRTRQLFADAYGENFIKVGVGKKLTITP